MINTVKIIGSGYLVNGSHSVPSAPGNSDYRAVQMWIAEGNTPDPEFTQAEIDAQAVATEQAWVEQELITADKEVNKHDDSHGRVVGTKPQWGAYRNALRDHVIGGVIRGERPSVPT